LVSLGGLQTFLRLIVNTKNPKIADYASKILIDILLSYKDNNSLINNNNNNKGKDERNDINLYLYIQNIAKRIQ
jgi:hypothetical protein